MTSSAEITVFRGDSYPIIFTLKDSATGAAINITGASFTLTVDDKKDPTGSSTKKFSVVGTIVGAASEGRVNFKPTTANTASAGNFFYDVQYTDASGNIRTIAKGKFTISQDITK